MLERYKVDREAFEKDEADRELAAIVRQRAYFRALADAFDRGEAPTEQHTLNVLALLLRQKADAIRPRKRRGKPPLLYDAGMAAFMVHELRAVEGFTYEEAVGHVALLFGVDDRTVGKEYDDRLTFVEGFFPAIKRPD